MQTTETQPPTQVQAHTPHETKPKHHAPPATAGKTTKWWKTQRARQIGVGMAVLALIGLIMWWFAFHPYISTDDARIAMTFVRVAPSNVSGRIEKVNVEEGSHVKAGDVLVEIDHRIPQANFDKAKAKSDLANRELSRMQRLTSEGSSTQQALDQARATAATADVELKLAEVALENTYLKSPFDGVIVQKTAEVGNLLEQNQTALVIADEAHAWVAANVEETAIGAVRIGQPVHISIDEGGDLEGQVSEIRASVASQFALIPSDSGAGNFTKVVQRVPIKVAITKRQEHPLRAGQSVEIKIRVH
jgi:membrane fusion protein (multidrug efflux system)